MRKAKTPKTDLAIIGMGYVGLPLGLQFAKTRCRVLGLDIDATKINEIEGGRSYTHNIPVCPEPKKYRSRHHSKNLKSILEDKK